MLITATGVGTAHQWGNGGGARCRERRRATTGSDGVDWGGVWCGAVLEQTWWEREGERGE
jgi:hypothetical protein